MSLYQPSPHTQMQEGSMSGSNGHTLCCRVHMASRHLLCWNSQPAPSVGGFILMLLLPSLRWMKRLPQRNSEPSDLLQTNSYHVKIKFIYDHYDCLNLIQDEFRGLGEQITGLLHEFAEKLTQADRNGSVDIFAWQPTCLLIAIRNKERAAAEVERRRGGSQVCIPQIETSRSYSRGLVLQHPTLHIYAGGVSRAHLACLFTKDLTISKSHDTIAP